jgi:hypothetical protein
MTRPRGPHFEKHWNICLYLKGILSVNQRKDVMSSMKGKSIKMVGGKKWRIRFRMSSRRKDRSGVAGKNRAVLECK